MTGQPVQAPTSFFTMIKDIDDGDKVCIIGTFCRLQGQEQ